MAGNSTATWGTPVNAYGGNSDAFVARVNFPDINSPYTPTAVSPADEDILGSVSGVSLVGSAFSDPDVGDSHVRTYWLIRRADSVYARADYDNTFDVVTTSGLTTHSVSGLVSGMK